MKREDKVFKDDKRIIEIIKKCEAMTIAFPDNEKPPYILPMNFGFEVINNKKIFYFHSHLKGIKNDYLDKKPLVSFSMYANTKLTLHENIACKSSMKFQCVRGVGKAEILENDEKISAFTSIMQQYAPTKNYDVTPAMVNSVCLWKITVDEWEGKSNYEI